MVDIAFIHAKPHRAHRVFAEAIGADFYPFLGNGTTPKEGQVSRFTQYITASFDYPSDYDCYLLEGGQPLLSAALASLRNDATVILLNADETFVNVVEGLDYYGPGEGYVHQLSMRQVDGIISVGEFVDEYVTRMGCNVPTEVVYPSIDADLFDDLIRVEPTLDRDLITTVGFGKPSVGFDILVEAFERVRENNPDAELHIAGQGHPKAWNDRPGVTVHGWVDDLATFLSQGSMSAHPGRCECYPVSTLEPMRAGCPTLVSNRVGTRSVVADLDERLVVEPTVEATADAIRWFFELSVDERREFSIRARELTEPYSEAKTAEMFVEAFERLTARLGNR